MTAATATTISIGQTYTGTPEALGAESEGDISSGATICHEKGLLLVKEPCTYNNFASYIVKNSINV